ncbi:hypothetical protein O3G_MSEX005691 [Manduca sexta]|uniref:Uncharacterized protein n=1 Tax=Manduca sexta TaxID=7130 RepID=A0A921Z0Y5_MANSE|nr:hypothetical protein O3G_MSEX005691 [Manduca sexta]
MIIISKNSGEMTFDKHEYQKAKTYTHELQVNHKKYLDTLKYDFLNRCSNPPICTKSPEDFDKVQTLASGSFGTVFLVRDTCTFEYHAMKAIEKAEVVRKRSTKQLHLEKKILQSIQFPFVMSVDFCCKDNLYVYFILPYEAGGELYSLIKKLGPFSEILMQFYSAQIVLALEYLHNCSIIHRDLKPENILLNESGYLKLVDWWALGVLIYEMSAAYPPFYNSNPIKLYEKVLGGQFKTPECMTPVCKSLVKNLLEVDPTKRYGSLKAGVYDIKSHQWFRDINWQSILCQKIIPPYIPVCRSSGDTANFAYVFRALEYPAELEKQEYHRDRLLTERWNLIRFVSERSNGTDYSDGVEKLLSDHLAAYEKVLEEASSSGLSLEVEKNFPPLEEKWSILQAVFFSSTVLTTIGYGNIVPETFWGRLFCIAYALIGIPLTLTVIADLGRVFATFVSFIAKQLPEMPKCCTRVTEANPAGQRSLYALGAVGFLFVYLSAGAGLFKMWEDDWSFYDGFYFCFITMTTIGFGDIVPKRPKYMLLCTLYILIGLALTSTIIELVRRQYARSWQQLRALSGPLADTLRRLGDAGRGVDVSSLHSDLRKVLTVVTMPRLSGAGGGALTDKRRLEWEAAVEAVIRDITSPVQQKPPIVQIVIYESSV